MTVARDLSRAMALPRLLLRALAVVLSSDKIWLHHIPISSCHESATLPSASAVSIKASATDKIKPMISSISVFIGDTCPDVVVIVSCHVD